MINVSSKVSVDKMANKLKDDMNVGLIEKDIGDNFIIKLEKICDVKLYVIKIIIKLN